MTHSFPDTTRPVVDRLTAILATWTAQIRERWSFHRGRDTEMTETTTVITWNNFAHALWHWVIVLWRVEPRFPPPHLPSGGRFRMSCRDLAPAWLTPMCTKRVGGSRLSSQLESCYCRWLLLLAYRWGLCAMRMNIYALKGVGGTCGYEDKDSTGGEYQGGVGKHWSVAWGRWRFLFSSLYDLKCLYSCDMNIQPTLFCEVRVVNLSYYLLHIKVKVDMVNLLRCRFNTLDIILAAACSILSTSTLIHTCCMIYWVGVVIQNIDFICECSIATAEQYNQNVQILCCK